MGLSAEGLELPEVNQIEVSVYYQQREFHKFAKEHNVALMGYCPLARCKRMGESGAVRDIATSHGVTEGQVLIRWSYQAGADFSLMTDRQTNRQTDIHTYRQTDRVRERKRGREE